MADDKKKCFIITPIGSADDPIRRHIDGIIDQAICPALDKKYDIDVAHRRYEIGSINDRVVKSIYNADLVIANLTGLNPNVMYELAIRHSFGKPAIVIAEEGTKLPFDVIDENTIFYINDPKGADDLKNKIISFESNIDLENQNYGPVYKALQTIALFKEIESGNEVSNEKILEYIISRLDTIDRYFANVNKIEIKPYEIQNNEQFEVIKFSFPSDSERKRVIDEYVLKRDWNEWGIIQPKTTKDGFAIVLTRNIGSNKKKRIVNKITDELMDIGFNHFLTEY